MYPNMKTVYDDQNFVRRIHKYKACRLNITLFKRALLSHWSVIEKVTVKIKKIGISNTQKRRKKRGENIEDERAEKINDGGIMGGLCFQDSNDSNDLKTIGIPSTEKKKEAAEENNDGVIKVIDSNSNTENFPAVVSLPTTENIMKHETLNDAKEAPEENNEGMFAETKDSILNLPAVVSALTTDIMKHEVDEAAVRKDVAGGDDVTGDMEVVEAGDAEGNEAVKDLLKESNVSGQEDKHTTELIQDDTEILDKGGGRKEKTEKTVRLERVII